MPRGSTHSTTAISVASSRITKAGRSASRRSLRRFPSRATRLEEIVEPFLLQQGFIGRTPRGRRLTLKTYRHLGVNGPARTASPELPIFDDGGGRDVTTLSASEVGDIHFFDSFFWTKFVR